MADSTLTGLIPVAVAGGIAMGMTQKMMSMGGSPAQYPKALRHIGKTSIVYKGKTYRRWKAGYSPEDRKWEKDTGDTFIVCESCGARKGQYHELGCDCEQCPICKKQLLSCGHGGLFGGK